MTFKNQKKTFLAKLDKSIKGSIDEKCLPLIKLINNLDDYYTTSSCSGRAYFWTGEKKNETEWFNVSHDLVTPIFFYIENKDLWLRVEPLIMHIACKDIDSANNLLQKAQSVCKKSSILTISNKIIVEIKGSEYLEMPYTYSENLQKIVNNKLKKINKKIEELEIIFSAS